MWCIGICIGRCVTCIHLECSLQSYLGTYVGSIFMKICSCNFVLTTNIERRSVYGLPTSSYALKRLEGNCIPRLNHGEWDSYAGLNPWLMYTNMMIKIDFILHT